MDKIASQITNLKSPAQMASNAENVSIWWRHHVKRAFLYHVKYYIQAISTTGPTYWPKSIA